MYDHMDGACGEKMRIWSLREFFAIFALEGLRGFGSKK